MAAITPTSLRTAPGESRCAASISVRAIGNEVGFGAEIARAPCLGVRHEGEDAVRLALAELLVPPSGEEAEDDESLDTLDDAVIVAVALRHRLEEPDDERRGAAQRLLLDRAVALDEAHPPPCEFLSLADLGDHRIGRAERKLDLALADLLPRALRHRDAEPQVR